MMKRILSCRCQVMKKETFSSFELVEYLKKIKIPTPLKYNDYSKVLHHRCKNNKRFFDPEINTTKLNLFPNMKN